MQFKTLIVNPDNWALAQHDIKDVMLWAIRDRPWYHVRTYAIDQELTFPVQLKTNSWTSVDVNTETSAPAEVIRDAGLIFHRMNFFKELYHRLAMSQGNLGLSNTTTLIVQLHEYLISQGLVRGEAKADAVVHYENKMRLLQDLNNIQETVITEVLASTTIEDFKRAKTTMERLFFTNILL
jgi:hypothetical protein